MLVLIPIILISYIVWHFIKVSQFNKNVPDNLRVKMPKVKFDAANNERFTNPIYSYLPYNIYHSSK